MTIAAYLLPKIEEAAKKAAKTGIDTISLEDGLFLIKQDSPEGEKRLSQKGSVAEKIVIDGVDYLLCNS